MQVAQHRAVLQHAWLCPQSPQLPASSPTAALAAAELGYRPLLQTHQRPARLNTAQRVLGKAAGAGGKVQCCDGKASQHQDVKPARAGGLVFSQRRGGQVQLEVLVLEDTAGGRVTVGNTEQPVLFTAMAARQFCQES